MLKYDPFIKGIYGNTYNKAFLLGAMIAVITAIIAVHFNELSSDRLARSVNCSEENQNLFCYINTSFYIRKLELILQTFTITILTYYVLFLLIGFGGTLRPYYAPTYTDVKDTTATMVVVLLLNCLFYYIVMLIGKRKIPSLYNVVYKVAEQYGFVEGLKPKNPSHKK